MKNNTAEKVIDFLSMQRLEATPRNYTLGYALVTRSSEEIDKAVRAITDDGVRLTQAEADDILDRFGLEGVRAVAMPTSENGEEALLHQMLRFGDLANDTRTATTAFGRDLDAQKDVLRENPQLAAVVAAMVERTRRAEMELASSMDEIGRLRQDLESARDDASRDKLTGLPNRRALDERLADIDRRGASCAIAICDIDRFKRINDTHGHGVGDRVITSVGQVIAKACAGQMVGRWGGEEFMVVMEGVSAAEGAEIVDAARDILSRKSFKLRESDEPLGQVTFSAGVAVERGTAESARVADERLYIAKQGGRNRVVHDQRASDMPVAA